MLNWDVPKKSLTRFYKEYLSTDYKIMQNPDKLSKNKC